MTILEGFSQASEADFRTLLSTVDPQTHSSILKLGAVTCMDHMHEFKGMLVEYVFFSLNSVAHSHQVPQYLC